MIILGYYMQLSPVYQCFNDSDILDGLGEDRWNPYMCPVFLLSMSYDIKNIINILNM